MNINLADRVALVTGAMDEIGTAICKQLADSGARVVIEYRDADAARGWQARMKGQGIDARIYQADLADFESCNRLIRQIEADSGPVDIVINSAESAGKCDFRYMDKARWDAVVQGNLDSVFNVCRHVVESMTARGFGRIINISSVKSRQGAPLESHFAASKAGIHGFTMALAQEVARKGVTVNTVSPGLLETADSGVDVSGIPAARPGRVAEVAYLVSFLCSEQAAYINGADIPVNGGCYMN